MKNYLLILLLSLPFLSHSAFSNCLPGGITFYTQTEVDNFSLDYPGCTEIGGDVTINGTDIENLQGLFDLESIGGNLSVVDNDALITLDGLENLLVVGGSLIISFNEALVSFSGLNNLQQIGGLLTFNGNINMTNVSGLGHLTTVGESLRIVGNDDLVSLNGLSDVIAIGDDGLGELVVANNHSLSTLYGLNNINYETIDSLAIVDCPNLSFCEIESICNYLENDGISSIYGNKNGCKTVAQIKNACLTVPVSEPLTQLVDIRLFPNPTSGFIQIEGLDTEKWSLSVWNVLGREILIDIPENGNLDLSNLPSGLYYLQMRNDRQSLVRQIIKE